MERTVGIDESKMNHLILETEGIIERIQDTFGQMETLVQSTSSFFEGEVGTAFRENFQVIANSFPIVNKNMLSYPKDLRNVNSSYKQFSIEEAEKINAYAQRKYSKEEGEKNGVSGK